jgi:hypothetical protein
MSKIPAEPDPGKENPSRRGRFKPGQSGNLQGRPKGSSTFRNEFAEIMKKKIGVREGGTQKHISRQRALVLRHLDKALAGDTPSANAIFHLLVKIEPQTSERVARNEALSESDDEIVADFLRRNQPSSS